jgi:hypothetical protein
LVAPEPVWGRPPEIRRALTEHLPPEDAPRLRSEIDTYSVRDTEARFRNALDWLLDGLLAEHR